MKLFSKYTFIILFSAGILAGCGVITKKYETPEVSETVQNDLYRGESSTDTTSMADIPWNEIFTDTILQGLIEEGLTQNNDLQVALFRVAEAQSIFKQQKQNWLPSFNFNPNVTFNNQSQAALNLPPNININLRTTTVQLPIGASWELDVWGKLKSAKKSAMASFFETQASAQAVRTQLIASVASTYFQLLALDEQKRVTEETVSLREKDVETLTAMIEASLANGAALEQTKSNLYSAQITLKDLENTIRETENAMSILLGRVPGEIKRSTFEEQNLDIDLQIGLPMQILENRPDVIAAEMSLRSRFEDVNVARASFYPSFTISAQGGLSALTTNSLFQNALFSSVTGGLLQPIYNNGVNKMNLRSSEARKQQALYSFYQTMLVAGQEVSNAMYAVQINSEKEDLRSQQIESLEKSVEFTKELLTYGNSTNYLDVLTSEQALLSAQLAGINDRLSKMLATVQLYRALGGGWQ